MNRTLPIHVRCCLFQEKACTSYILGLMNKACNGTQQSYWWENRWFGMTRAGTSASQYPNHCDLRRNASQIHLYLATFSYYTLPKRGIAESKCRHCKVQVWISDVADTHDAVTTIYMFYMECAITQCFRSDLQRTSGSSHPFSIYIFHQICFRWKFFILQPHSFSHYFHSVTA